MRNFKAPFWAAALLIVSAPAMAQEMFPGQSVTVNSGAAGGRPLLYPGGEYLRVQPQLLQPFQRPTPEAPIQLRPPGSKPARAATATTARPAPIPQSKVAAEPKPEPEVVAEPKPVPRPAERKPQPSIAARPVPPPPAPPKQVAKAEPAPARTQTPAPAPSIADEMAGWNKSGLIEFMPEQGEVAEGRVDAVRFLAGSLNSALSSSPSNRVQIVAYGGTRGDKGSDARRLSLRRALSVRQLLIDAGVSKDQIDVRAMGGADDGGPADRVDVYVRS